MILEHQDKGGGNTASPRSLKNKQNCPAQVLLSHASKSTIVQENASSSGELGGCSFVVLARAPSFSSALDLFLSQIFARNPGSILASGIKRIPAEAWCRHERINLDVSLWIWQQPSPLASAPLTCSDTPPCQYLHQRRHEMPQKTQ